MKNLKAVLALAVVLATVVGCSKGPKKPADLPKLYPATVKVVYDDGTPVAEAMVTLVKADGTSSPWNLTGVTDAQGVLVMKTHGNWDGAPAGDYQGMVTKEISEKEAPTEAGGSVKIKGITNYVDKMYGDPVKSGLVAKVVEGENNFEFKVGEQITEDVEVVGAN